MLPFMRVVLVSQTAHLVVPVALVVPSIEPLVVPLIEPLVVPLVVPVAVITSQAGGVHCIVVAYSPLKCVHQCIQCSTGGGTPGNARRPGLSSTANGIANLAQI